MFLNSIRSYAVNKSRSKSIKWYLQQINDPYVKRAHRENYRARSAFKLLWIDDKFRLFGPGSVVIDCGGAPGSWSQVAVTRTIADKSDASAKQGTVICIDKDHFPNVPGAINLPYHDLTAPETTQRVCEILNGRKADCIISDMAPNRTGVSYVDVPAMLGLCNLALSFATENNFLKPGGTFICKLWQTNQEQHKLLDAIKEHFEQVKILKPDGSRTTSAEIYFLSRIYKPV